MILSDRDIRAAIDAGRLVVEPLGPNAIQPSSVDVRIGSRFRVFANSRYPYIDVHDPMEDLTELVEVDDDTPFILHPGEFVLGTTLESVSVPDDLVARLEGKSSLARLGLLIHSSLPAGEPVLFLHDGEVRQRPIDEIVRKQLPGSVVSFDPATFEVSFTPVTGWYEGPPDRIHEVVLSSGRHVRVTAGHNLFTLDRNGELTKTRTAALAPGSRVALPRAIPDPPGSETPVFDLRALMPERESSDWMCEGPTVRTAWHEHRETCRDALASDGIGHPAWYEESARVTLAAARQVPGLVSALDSGDRLRPKGARYGLPPVLPVDTELAWLLGIYVAEGYHRRQQVVIANEDPEILDRAEAILDDLGLGTSRNDHAVVAGSLALSSLFEWIGLDGHSRQKRLPDMSLGWPTPILAALLEGFIDGDGSRNETRNSLWTSSPGLVDDLLLLCARLGLRASAYSRQRDTGTAFQVTVPHREHKVLTAIPLPDRLLVELREDLGLSQVEASHRMGERYPTNLCNIENRSGRDVVRRRTLARILEAYREAGRPRGLARLERLVEADLLWDTVVEVRDTRERETIFDLEVRPDGRPVENFLAGGGGVFVSNTAGFVDAGWTGHLTLELSNVANLPITLYPGMKIGQLAFFQLSSSAEHPYGSSEVGSKYHGQHDPTPSRYHLNFEEDTDA